MNEQIQKIQGEFDDDFTDDQDLDMSTTNDNNNSLIPLDKDQFFILKMPWKQPFLIQDGNLSFEQYWDS